MQFVIGIVVVLGSTLMYIYVHIAQFLNFEEHVTYIINCQFKCHYHYATPLLSFFFKHTSILFPGAEGCHNNDDN